MWTAEMKCLPPPAPANTYGALLVALDLAHAPLPDWKKRCPADTVFLITSSLPGTGQIRQAPKIIEVITELNRTRGVTFHLIAFTRTPVSSLSPLALINGGEHVLIGQ